MFALRGTDGMRSLLCAFVLLASISHVTLQTGPASCYYDDGWFRCDYGGMAPSDRPIDFTQFSIQPQLLEINVNGYMPYTGDTQTFSDTFLNMDKSTFDANIPGTLTVYCGWSGGLYLATGAFYNMSYVQHLKIKDCNTHNIPASVFADFGDLDYFAFENGYIDSVDPNAMVGLNVEKLTTDTHQIPRNLGTFEILFSKFVSQSLPPGLMFNWKNLTSATIMGADLTTIETNTFKYNTKLKHLDLSYNLFTSLPSGLFDGLVSLSDIHVYGIDWYCSCDNTWFIGYADDNNITIYSNLYCSNTQGTARKYWYNKCVSDDPCRHDGLYGNAIGQQCLTYIATVAYAAAIISLGMAWSALVLAIKNYQVVLSKLDDEVIDLDTRTDLRRSRLIRNRWKKATKRIILMLRFKRTIAETPDDVDDTTNGATEMAEVNNSHQRQPYAHTVNFKLTTSQFMPENNPRQPKGILRKSYL